MFYKNNTFGKLKKNPHEHRENGDMFQLKMVTGGSKLINFIQWISPDSK